MTMDFYPPRVERPARGILFVAIAVPIGVIGYWFVSWSLLLIALFMVFLGLIEVLLYRSGARTRVIRRGRTSLLAAGSVVVILSVVGGAAIPLLRSTVATATARTAAAGTAIAPSLSGTPDVALLGALIGVGAGIGSLIYFTRRFSTPGGAEPR